MAQPLLKPCTPSTDETIPEPLGVTLLASRPVNMLSKRPRLRGLIERAARRALTAVDRAAPGRPTGQPTREQANEHDRKDPIAIDQANTLREAEGTGLAAPEVASSETATPAHARVPAGAGFERELMPQRLALEQATVSRVLYDRLSESDILEVEQLIRDTPGAWEHYAGAGDDAARRDVLLALGVWLEADSLMAKTGLVRPEPPDEVHAMTRGALAAAGGLYEANLLADALRGVGTEMESLQSALDFGCSSGRVVRSLAAAYPEVKWHGCDPNQPAIVWATENLPAVEFFVNGDSPPLPLADGALDMAYAISIWSHFSPELGRRWFTEMYRVIRPGGHLVITTHGMTSVAYYALRRLRAPEQSNEILDSLYRRGSWYAAEFGDEGDWGVVNSDWGTAFLSPEWILTQLCPLWRVLEYAPGRNQDNQDLYVLQRV